MRFLFLIFFLSLSHYTFSQEIDTLSIADSLQAPFLHDSLSVSDTTAKKTYDVDTTIFTESSDSLIFYVKKKKMDIYGDASIQYRETDLKSANIFVDFQTNNIDAEGVPSDTLPNKFKGTPVLKEGADTYNGFKMRYNFKPKEDLFLLQERKPMERSIREQRSIKLMKILTL